jgi:hypothetical protein
MHKDAVIYTDSEVTIETSRLLSELDDVIDHSGVMREIVDRYECLRNLESLTGPSPRTRILRKEIKLMELKLRLERAGRQLRVGNQFSPA